MPIDALLDTVAAKVPLDIKLNPLESRVQPSYPEQVRTFMDGVSVRMSKDAKANGVTDTEFRAEKEGNGVGDILYCKYELPDGKTTVGISIVASRTDEQLVKADEIRRKQRDESEMIELLGIEGVRIDDLSQLVGSISFRRKDEHPIKTMFGGVTAKNPDKLGAEHWTLFKVVKNGKVELRLTTDSSIVGPMDPNEEGTWLVPAKKLDFATEQFKNAKFIKGEYTPRDQQEIDALTEGTSL
jgi:hypothetical protein